MAIPAEGSVTRWSGAIKAGEAPEAAAEAASALWGRTSTTSRGWRGSGWRTVTVPPRMRKTPP